MNIFILDKKLSKVHLNNKKIIQEYGKLRGEKIIKRLQQLKIAETLEEVRNLPGNFHELIGNRKGQWACDLDQPYRLIFQPKVKPIHQNKSGHYIWSEIKIIEVIEIVDYH